MAKSKKYQDPRKPNPKPKGRYHGDSPTYRRNQIGDYTSNNDRFEKAIDLVPGVVDQNNPYLYASGEADDGYWRVFIIKATCRDLCGGCSGESGKIIIHPGEQPIRAFFAVGPGISFDPLATHIQLHRWSEVPTSFGDISTKRFWYSDLPYNSIVSLPPGIWSVSARNPAKPDAPFNWDSVCLGFGQVAQASLTIELLSYD
jgi:hypothetical protein